MIRMERSVWSCTRRLGVRIHSENHWHTRRGSGDDGGMMIVGPFNTTLTYSGSNSTWFQCRLLLISIDYLLLVLSGYVIYLFLSMFLCSKQIIKLLAKTTKSDHCIHDQLHCGLSVCNEWRYSDHWQCDSRWLPPPNCKGNTLLVVWQWCDRGCGWFLFHEQWCSVLYFQWNLCHIHKLHVWGQHPDHDTIVTLGKVRAVLYRWSYGAVWRLFFYQQQPIGPSADLSLECSHCHHFKHWFCGMFPLKMFLYLVLLWRVVKVTVMFYEKSTVWKLVTLLNILQLTKNDFAI